LFFHGKHRKHGMAIENGVLLLLLFRGA